MKKLISVTLATLLLLALCACGAAPEPASEPETPPAAEPAAAGEYRLTAGQREEVSALTFPEEVTVYIDPASTADVRSEIAFTDCVFEKGLRIVGDGSGWIGVDAGCSFGEGCGVTAEEATPGSAKAATIDDDFIKLSLGQSGVNVTTTTLLTVISDQDEFTLNGTTFHLADFERSNMYCAAFYYENGEGTFYTEGWMEEELPE